MPVYDICYLHRSGVLASQYSTICESDMQAKTLAHAMKQPDFKRFEVWDGEVLVYQRPQNPN